MPTTDTEAATKRETLQACYQQLSAQGQKILRVFSVVYEPVTMTSMQNILAELDRQHDQGPALKPLMVKPFRDKMVEQGLLVLKKGRLMCHHTFVELLTREAVKKDEFQRMVSATRIMLPAQQPRSYYYRDAYRDIHTLRVALYQNNEKKIDEQLQHFNNHHHFGQLFGWDCDVLTMIVANPLEEEWLIKLPEKIVMEVLHLALTSSVRHFRANDQVYEILQHFNQPTPAPPWCWMLFEQQLLRGEVAGSEKGLPEPSSMETMVLFGWQQFILGENESAIETYLQALKEGKKSTGKRNVYIPGLGGVFFILALISSGEPEHLALAKIQTSMALKLNWDWLINVYHLLDQYLSVRSGKSHITAHPMFSEDEVGDTIPFGLFKAMVQIWLGEQPGDDALLSLKAQAELATGSGYLWYASACAGLIDRLIEFNQDQPVDGDRSGSEQAAQPYYNLVNLVPTEAPWQRTLKALQGLNPSNQQSAKNTAAAVELRMVWFFEDSQYGLSITPREQKLSKTGRWSKGRPIALKRLYEEPETFDYITPDDLKIVHQIEREISYGSYGRHPKESFYLSDRALLAAVGHPLIVRADEPTRSVELLKGEQLLVVRKKRDKLLLQLQPKINTQRGVLVVAEGSDRLRLTEITDQHRAVAMLLGKDGLQVPLSARQQVLDSIAAIAPLMTVHSEIGGGSALETVEASSLPHIRLQPVGEGLKLEIVVQPFADGGPLLQPGSGGATVFAEINGKQIQAERNLKQERERAEVIYQQCPSLQANEQGDYLLDDPEEALETLFALQTLGEEQVVLEWPQGKSVHLSREVHPSQVSLSVRKEQNWFSLNGEVAIADGETLEMMRLIELLDHATGRFLKLKDGQFLALTEELRQRLDQMRAIGTQKGGKLQIHPLAAGIVDDLSQEMQLKAGKHWKEQLQRISSAQSLEPELPSTLQADLRDYQLDGFRWLAQLAHWGAGACLADDMGLGKTLQSLALVLTRAMHGPTLVIAPTSVCMNWQAEARKFAPTLKVYLFGSGDRQAMLDQAGPFDLVISSYGLIQSESQRFQQKKWQTIVVDEAQAIKNGQTKRSKAIMALQGEFRLITTGTPIENHLGELWNLYQFINPGLLGSLNRFNQRFAIPIEQNNDPAARQHLKQLTQPFILRRLKRDVLTELPSRTEITLQVELNPSEKALIEALRRKALEELEKKESPQQGGHKQLKILAEIMRLRRACCNPALVMPDTSIESSKLQAFAELVEELLENRHKALVFSQFVDHLKILRGWLDDKGIEYQYLDGSTPQKKRQQAVDAFQTGQGELFLISLKAGGAGLNLTAADYVIHMDPWWNPAVEDQASDRAHRIGQQRPVTIYRLIAKDTIEEKIVALHKHKRDLADSLLEGSEMSAKMSVEEMMALIRDVQ